MHKQYLLILICFLSVALGAKAQNTLDGEAKIVPEKEVNRQSVFIEAEQQRMLDQPEKAAELYQKFLYDHPQNDAAWYGLARAHGTLKSWGDALQAIDKAIKIDDTNEWYLIYQADILEKLGQIGEAVEVYEKLVEQQPNNPRFYEQLAYLQVLNENPKDALKTLNKLEGFLGITETISSKKHVIYLGLEDYKKAAQEIERLIDAYPGNTAFRHQLARFYEAAGKENEARQVYREILEVDPYDDVARLAARAASESSSETAHLSSLRPLFADPTVSIDAKIKELAPYLSKIENSGDDAFLTALFALGSDLEKAHPSNPKSWSISGDLYYLAGNNAEALKRYQQCIELNPGVYAVWENSLRILFEQENYEALYTLSDKAIDAFPNQALSYYLFGLSASMTSRSAEAIPLLNQAILMSGRDLSLQKDIRAC